MDNYLNKETLKNAYIAFTNPKLVKDKFTNGRHLGWLEANLIELGVLKIGQPFPYLETKYGKEDYESMILRLTQETLQKFLNLSHRLVVVYGTPEHIKDLETWALPHALQNAILFEEYEICERIKNEIELRNG